MDAGSGSKLWGCRSKFQMKFHGSMLKLSLVELLLDSVVSEQVKIFVHWNIIQFQLFAILQKESFKTSLYPQWKRPTEQLIEQQQKGHRVKESTNLNLGRIKRSVVDICCLYFGRLVGRFENSQKSISFKFHRWVVSLVVVASGAPSGGWLRKRSIQFIIHLKLCDAFYEQHKHRPATGFLMSWVSRWCRVKRRNNYCLTKQSCNQFKVSNTVRCL